MIDRLEAIKPSVFVAFDYAVISGDTLKEKYEGIYVKLVELRNTLTAKGHPAGSVVISVGESIANLLMTSRTYCFAGPPDTSKDRSDIGEFHIGGACKVFLDKSLLHNEAVVECGIGKGLLVVNDLPHWGDS